MNELKQEASRKLVLLASALISEDYSHANALAIELTRITRSIELTQQQADDEAEGIIT